MLIVYLLERKLLLFKHPSPIDRCWENLKNIRNQFSLVSRCLFTTFHRFIYHCQQNLLQVVCFGKISGSHGHWMLNIFESILPLSTIRMCLITQGDLVILAWQTPKLKWVLFSTLDQDGIGMWKNVYRRLQASIKTFQLVSSKLLHCLPVMSYGSAKQPIWGNFRVLLPILEICDFEQFLGRQRLEGLP